MILFERAESDFLHRLQAALPRFGGLLWKKRERCLTGWQKQGWTSVQAAFFFI
jgi:hypothetical protein